MEFNHRLDELLRRLSFSNIQVARAAGTDPSLISRFRTGKRVPSRNNPHLPRIARGMVHLAMEEEKTEILYAICSSGGELSEKSLEETVLRWLADENTGLQKIRRCPQTAAKKEKREILLSFNKKLDLLMRTHHVSNIRLARALNVDASLISRFRTGTRSLAADSWLLTEISAYFSARAAAMGGEEELLGLLVQSGASISPAGDESLQHILLHWLRREKDCGGVRLMNKFLEKIDVYQPPAAPMAAATETILMPEIGPPRSVFYGENGLRDAVVRFLTMAAEQKEPRTLALYSDQPLRWLSADDAFARTWAALMAGTMARGNRIRIIHNVDRCLEEMLEAIAKWLPLYMTGRIEPFYCKKQGGQRFRQTRFIIPQIASLAGAFVAGTEDTARYHLETDAEAVQYQEKQFEALLALSAPLMHIRPLADADAFLRAFQQLGEKKGHIKTILPAMSLSTMEPALLERILGRSGLSEEEKESVRAYKANVDRLFRRALEEGDVTEILPLPEQSEVIAGQVKISLPGILSRAPLYYSAGDYQSHILHIIRLLKTATRYRICLLPNPPFQNLHIIIRNSDAVLLLKGDPAATSFLFQHPLMCRAFENYAEAVNGQTPLDPYDREAVIRRLMESASLYGTMPPADSN